MDINKYKELLKRHDWCYEYSDDYNAWRKGHFEMEELRLHSKDSTQHTRYLKNGTYGLVR